MRFSGARACADFAQSSTIFSKTFRRFLGSSSTSAGNLSRAPFNAFVGVAPLASSDDTLKRVPQTARRKPPAREPSSTAVINKAHRDALFLNLPSVNPATLAVIGMISLKTLRLLSSSAYFFFNAPKLASFTTLLGLALFALSGERLRMLS